MTASGSVSTTTSRVSPASQVTDDLYASPPRILPHSGILQQGVLPASVRRPVAHRAGLPTAQTQQQGYCEMTSLVASRYGERYASAPALSSVHSGAPLSYNSSTLHRNYRIGNNNQLGTNHYNTMGGPRRYHTPIGSSTAELSVFSSEVSNQSSGHRSMGNEISSIRITTPNLHNSLDRRLFTRNNQNHTNKNHSLTMMRHHHQAGRNSSASWHNQSSPNHHQHQQQQQTTSPPILTPSPSDSGFASGIENSGNDVKTSVTPSTVSIASGRTSSGNSIDTNGRICRSSKIYINGDGEFFNDDWGSGKTNNRNTTEKNSIISNEAVEYCSNKPNNSIKECDKYWDFCNESYKTNGCSNKKCSKETAGNECACYQVTSLRSKLEEAMWEQGRIRGEAALLRQQLKETRNALSARELDLMRLRHDNKQNYECPGDSHCAESERLRTELSSRVLEFEAERERWLQEKKQVLRYQRCLLKQLADASEEQV